MHNKEIKLTYFLIETIGTPMKYQAHDIKRYKAVSIAVKGKIIKIDLEKQNVVIKDGLTKNYPVKS